MKKYAPLLLLPLLAPLPSATRAQVSQPPPLTVVAAATVDPDYSRLRGITQLYLDVTSTDPASDAELRGEVRDLMELEFRRSNIAVLNFSPTSREVPTPVLQLHLKMERSLGRVNCEIELSVLDRVQIVRNKELINAITFKTSRQVGMLSEQAVSRDVRNRVREMIREFIKGMKNNP
jgi:predicted transcriptional regulator